MEFSLDQMAGSNTSTTLPKKIHRPKDIRIIQVVGGYTINKSGDEFYPLEVCVTLEEVKQKVSEFFTQESDASNEENKSQEAAPAGNPEAPADSNQGGNEETQESV